MKVKKMISGSKTKAKVAGKVKGAKTK